MEEGKAPSFNTPAVVQEKRREAEPESDGVADPDDIDFGDLSKDDAQ